MPAKLFNPNSEEPFVLSRSRIDNFLECPRCFYLTNRAGIARPPSFPFNLNNAVDELLKNEFDVYREKGEPHPIMVENNLKAIPYEHPDLEEWRESLRHGVKRHHKETNLILRGGLFNNLLEFKTKLIPYKGNDSWVEPTLTEVKETLMQDSPPEADSKCSYCAYVKKTLLI